MNAYEMENQELNPALVKYHGMASMLIPWAKPEMAFALKRRYKDFLFCTTSQRKLMSR